MVSNRLVGSGLKPSWGRNMRIQVNGEAQELESGQSVAELVFQLSGSHESKGIAVAINGQIVSRHDWAERALQDNDEVEVLRAVSGG